MREESRQDLMASEEAGAKYDEVVRALWRNREILAPLLKYAVEELGDKSAQEIIELIDADTISSVMPVSDLPPEVVDRGTEQKSVTEKAVTYDFHFKVKTRSCPVRIFW